MGWKIPQVKPWIGAEEAAAAATAITDTWITEGPCTERFSESLNELIGVPYGVFAPNGTLALALGLMAMGIGPGDEVLVPDITFIGSANSVIMTGAVPVLVEVTGDNFQIDAAKAEAMIGPRTRAIMPVHLFGMACNMDAVQALADRHNLAIIEDAAQGIGVRYDGRHVGGLGQVGCFSFYADKTITTGEGGYVVCRDSKTHDALRLLRNQGRLDRGSFIHPAIGYNFRITDMQAAMGCVQMGRLPEIVARKARLLELYRKGLAGIPQIRFLTQEPKSNRVAFRCVLICEQVEGLVRHLEAAGIQTRRFFHPMHRQPCFNDGANRVRQLDDAAYANANLGAERGLCLPIYPTLSAEDVAMITGEVRSFYTDGPKC